jgi:hydro-lyases, Fe-S type, tartrate/fumarate subfamily, beta region
MIKIHTDELIYCKSEFIAGTDIYLTGYVYTARDAAHKRIVNLIDSGKINELPFDLKGSIIYYCGTAPAPDFMPVGSCGPTTSSRMDIYTPKLLDAGVIATIGKGERSDEVIKSIKDNQSIYLCAIGGAGALLAKCVKNCEEVAFPELFCESVKKLYIKDFHLVVGIDSAGRNIFSKKIKAS